MARGGFPGGFGGGNMNNLMKQAQKLQKQMIEDLILSAVNEVLRKAEDETANKMGKLTGGMGGLF